MKFNDLKKKISYYEEHKLEIENLEKYLDGNLSFSLHKSSSVLEQTKASNTLNKYLKNALENYINEMKYKLKEIEKDLNITE